MDLLLGVTVSGAKKDDVELNPLDVARTLSFSVGRWFHTGEGKEGAMSVAGLMCPEDPVSLARQGGSGSQGRFRAARRPMNFLTNATPATSILDQLPQQTRPAPIDQRGVDRDAWITSPEFERERAANMGASLHRHRQTVPACTGIVRPSPRWDVARRWVN